MGLELVIAGWFASPAIGQLIGLAISYIKEMPVWLSMKKQLKKLHAALQRIQAVVEKVEKLQVINDCTPAHEAWLWQLKDAVDEAKDVLDELEYYKLRDEVKSKGEKVRATASRYTKKIIRRTAFAFKHGTSLKKKLKRAVKILDHVADSAGDFLNLHDLSNEHGARQQQTEPHEDGCLVTEDEVFGREKEMAKIVGWLKMPESGEHESTVKNVTVLPIVGAAGMGKTTLAQHVYREGKGSFDLTMWVSVSNNFDVVGIMKKIIRAATRENTQAEELSTLQEILTENLESHKFLLVLDNVWNDDDKKKWEDLIAPLKNGKQGSKILLTTRWNSVAEMIGKVMGETEEPVNLRGIKWNAYLSLFNKHAFAGVNPDDYKKLKLIGNRLAKKLWGSPLVAKIVGGMLNSNLNFEFWNEVLKNGIFNSIQNDDLQPVLRLSYIHLSPQLQRCFRYCSIFPQDYLFEKDELVHMWMAAGLIQQPEDGKRRPEDIGGEYFDSLLRKSFFDWALRLDGMKITYYVIHDLLHKMVCSVSKDECLGVDYRKPNPRDIPTTLRHLSIMVDDPLVLSKLPRLKNLHTLVLWIHGHDHRWDDRVSKLLKGLKNLRVLRLESSATCKRRSLKAIGDLKHLRYLHLDEIADITQLPRSVYKLYHLQTIIVLHLHPSTKGIGEGMKSLINLRHLILPSEGIPTIAKIGKLTSLQELDEFHVREGKGCKIGELKHLRDLRGELHIKNLENVRSYEDATEAELHNKGHLSTLVLQWDTDSNGTSEVAAKVIDGLQPHSTLADLKIIGYSGACPPCWLETRDLALLESITLSNCKELELLPPLEKLPFLKFLSLENMRALRQVGHPFPIRHTVPAFQSLEVLKFRNIQMLAKWSGVQDGRWFPRLKSLKIEHCSRLTAVPPLPHSLERLEIYDVGLTTLPRLWQCENNDCESSSSSNLRLLKIQSCCKLTSLAAGLLQHTDHFMAVEELFIQQCEALVHLPVEGFQKLISLRSLQIRKCPRLQRHDAPHDDFFFPSSLRTISMLDCGEMDASLPGAMQHLSSLSLMHLWECKSITAFPSAEVFRRLEMLHNLCIVRCTELASLGGLQALISLKRLEIRGCPKLVEAAEAAAAAAAATPPLTSDPDEGAADGSALSLDILKIDDPSLLHLEQLRSLTSDVHLWDCSGLPSLPEELSLQVRSPDQEPQLNRALSLRFLSGSSKKLASLQVSTAVTARTAQFTDSDSELEDRFHKKIGHNWNRIANIQQAIVQSKKQRT